MQRVTPLYSEYMTSEEDFPGFSFFFFVSSGRLSGINRHEDVDVVFFLSFFLPPTAEQTRFLSSQKEGGDKSGLGKQTRHRLCTFREKRKTSPSSLFFSLVLPPDSFFFLRFGGVLWSSDQGDGGTDDAFSKGFTHKG